MSCCWLLLMFTSLLPALSSAVQSKHLTRQNYSSDVSTAQSVSCGIAEGFVEGTIRQFAETNLQLGELKAKLSVTEELNKQLAEQLQELKGTLEQTVPVGFTVRMSRDTTVNVTLYQAVKFDQVVYNAGGGYDSNTGVFTAPKAGTYVFFLQALCKDADGRIFLDVVKNGQFLARMHAGLSLFENGSTMTLARLEIGETINVQAAFGFGFWGGVYSSFSGFRVSL